MSTHQSIPKPANANKKSDILPLVAPIQSCPCVAQPKIESTRSNEEQLAMMRAKREASERLGSTLLIPESVPRTLPPLQPKLTIGQPGDMYEQEADRVARQVVDHINAPPKIQAKAPRIQMQDVGQRKPMNLDHHRHTLDPYAGTNGQDEKNYGLTESTKQASSVRIEPRLDVRSYPALPIERFPKDHLFIVYTTSHGNPYFYRGGQGNSCRSFGFKGISTAHGRYDSESVDWYPDARSSTVARGNQIPDNVHECFTQTLGRIRNECVTYNPWGPNSNTVVKTLLSRCGLPTNRNPVPSDQTPGYDMDPII